MVSHQKLVDVPLLELWPFAISVLDTKLYHKPYNMYQICSQFGNQIFYSCLFYELMK